MGTYYVAKVVDGAGAFPVDFVVLEGAVTFSW